MASGVSVRMVRHYESTGLLRPPARAPSGYRDYGEADLHRLRFIAAARAVPLPFDEIRGLLDLWDDEARTAVDAAVAARERAGRLATSAEALTRVHDALVRFAEEGAAGRRAGHPLMPEPSRRSDSERDSDQP